MEQPQIYKSILDKIRKKQINPIPLRIFFSHAEEDKKLAGEIKNELKKFQINIFLAHDDMIPMEPAWDVQIKENIENCDVFLSLFTENFIKSEWTCQEIGIALGMNKSILSLKTNVDPTGFLQKGQALKLKINDIHESCLEIIKTINIITKNNSNNDILKNCIIYSLRNVRNFADGEKLLIILKDFKFNNNQINEIFGSAILNHQIRMSQLGKSQLKEWRTTYSNRLNPDIIETFEKIKDDFHYTIYD